jgi:hypothetical protein
MKIFAYILYFYLTALTVLPSVRAVKMQFSEKCHSTYQNDNSKNQEPTGCEKGKIIMNLSFNPVNYITHQFSSINTKIVFIEIENKENIIYKEVFISQYKSSIWQPPKIFS